MKKDYKYWCYVFLFIVINLVLCYKVIQDKFGYVDFK